MKSLLKKCSYIVLALLMLIPSKIFADPQPQWVIDKYEPFTYWFPLNGVNQDLAYRLLRPINFDASKKYPVIITLHGASGFNDPDQVKVYNINSLRECNGQLADDAVRTQYPAYVICPQAKQKDMWGRKHLTGLKQIIAALPSVDMNRIYVMGQSAGGHGSNVFIALDPNYFAAAIIGSADFSKINVDDISKFVNFNIWAIHGENDTTSKYVNTNAFFNIEMKPKNAKMKFTTLFAHGHSTEDLIIGVYSTFSNVVTDRIKNGYKTEFGGTDSDSETDTLKWLFSKSKADNLGIVDYNNALFTIYPNPTNSFVNWTNSLPIDQVAVNDSNGKVLLTIKKPTANNVDISTLTNGLYFINFYQNDKSVCTKKIIKDK